MAHCPSPGDAGRYESAQGHYRSWGLSWYDWPQMQSAFHCLLALSPVKMDPGGQTVLSLRAGGGGEGRDRANIKSGSQCVPENLIPASGQPYKKRSLPPIKVEEAEAQRG